MNILQFAYKSLSLSPLRAFEYEEIQKNELSGKVLDLGGGKVATYLKLFRGKYKLTSINIDPKTKPTVVGDITKILPFKDNEFDAVISFNTFEHIPEFEKTFSETYRVLKRGGKLIFSTPFLKEVHASPDDYWRYSSSAIESLLKKYHFSIDRIIPLGTGLFSVHYSLLYGPLPKVLRPFVGGLSLLFDATMKKIWPRYRKSCSENTFPLCYFVYAQKL